MTSSDNTQNDTVSSCHKAPMRVVGSAEGTNHYECTECGEACNWTSTSDTQNDSTELRDQILGYVSSLAVNDYHRASMITKDVDAVMKLITQYGIEQRIDEIKRMQQSGFVSEFYARPRLMALQATKPEKESDE